MAGPEDDDTLELDEALEEQSEGDEQEKQAESETGEEEPGNDEEVVSFGDEGPPPSGEAETGLVRHLREQIKERDRRIREMANPVVTAQDPGPEPDFDADADGSKWSFDHSLWKQDWLKWQGKKQAFEAETAKAKQAQQQQADAWQSELKAHGDKRAALKFKDVQEAEDMVTETLSDVQQAVIVKAAENSAMVVYALGKHPDKLAEISKITDPLKLAAAIARLEGKLTVTKRNGPPEPERIARGSASVEIGSGDKTLARLEAEAERSGDRTKLLAYKRQKRADAA